MGDIVVVRTYMSEPEARLAATVLEANGIPAHVMADTAGGALPSIALLFPIRLLVRAVDEELARDLLDSSIDDDMDEAVDEGDGSEVDNPYDDGTGA
jgi:hypothetical protein